jgi:hypothetical protein
MVVVEKAKRRMTMRPLEANTNRGARQAAPKADAVASDPPQSVASEGGTASPKAVDVSDVDGGTERPDPNCEISPGKNLDLRDGAGSSEGVDVPNDHGSWERAVSADNLSQWEKPEPDAVTKYVHAITGNWRRGIEALLEIARLCAEAEEQLEPAQHAGLKAKLPFGATTFSKFRQIGLDARLRKPEVQLLLPAAYTTIYAITCLNDGDLNDAITEKVINPDVKREKLEKWRKGREATRERQPDLSDNPAGSLANSVSDSVDEKKDDVADSRVPDEAPVLVPPAPSELMPDAAADVISPSHSIKLTGDENITSVLDGSSWSAEDQADLNLLNATWDRASDPVRAQFRARIGAGTSDLGDEFK